MTLEQYDIMGHRKYSMLGYRAAVREKARKDRQADRSEARDQELRDQTLGSLAAGGAMGLAAGTPIPPVTLDDSWPQTEDQDDEHLEETESRPHRTPGTGKV